MKITFRIARATLFHGRPRYTRPQEVATSTHQRRRALLAVTHSPHLSLSVQRRQTCTRVRAQGADSHEIFSLHNHYSGQLHAIAAKMDEGEHHSRQATGGFDVDQSRTAAGESHSSPFVAGSGNVKAWTSRARGAMVGPRAVSGSFQSKVDGQTAFQQTKRRLAKQVCVREAERAERERGGGGGGE